jgi:hypothetical protein
MTKKERGQVKKEAIVDAKRRQVTSNPLSKNKNINAK